MGVSLKGRGSDLRSQLTNRPNPGVFKRKLVRYSPHWRGAPSRWRAAYAESHDGVVWTKPDLGLVEFACNKNNNLLSMGSEDRGFVNLKVIKDEADLYPSRRYKMTTHVYFRHHNRLGTQLPFVSADGFSWAPVREVKPYRAELRKEDLFLPGEHFEPCGGLYHWDGFYYISGQNASPGHHRYQGRVSRPCRSADFVNWSPTISGKAN